MRMDTEWLEVTRHTTLDNSRTDSLSQILRIEKNDKNFCIFLSALYGIGD